jgi:hypothetical protein
VRRCFGKCVGFPLAHDRRSLDRLRLCDLRTERKMPHRSNKMIHPLDDGCVGGRPLCGNTMTLTTQSEPPVSSPMIWKFMISPRTDMVERGFWCDPASAITPPFGEIDFRHSRRCVSGIRYGRDKSGAGGGSRTHTSSRALRIFIPLRLSPPPSGVRGLDYPFTSTPVSIDVFRRRPSSLYTFPSSGAWLGIAT